MKVYDYKCMNCGHKDEVFVKGEVKATLTCPHCNGSFRRLLTAPAFTMGENVTAYKVLSENHRKKEAKKDEKRRRGDAQ